ncbi:MAG: efflux RND transporter periplasmic adaptor subunit [Gammaproteobacteria bacterium]|nr:efflux RND transporter periplasmic adaptor subunit [Gammaproteobacteria bacterium]
MRAERVLILLGVFIAGAAAGGAGLWLLRRPDPPAVQTAGANQPGHAAGRRILYYRAPMNPAIHSPTPMKDSMGMPYIPVYAGTASEPSQPGLIRIDPRLVQNFGVQTAPVAEGPLSRAIDAAGTVAVDQRLVSTLNPRVNGWLIHLGPRAVGDTVHRGEAVAWLYSPQLYQAERDYLLLRKGRLHGPGGERSLRQAAAERLRLLGLSDAQVRRLAQEGRARYTTPLLAAHDGIVTRLGTREGGYVTPATSLLTVTGLHRVWVNVALYSDQAPWVSVGDHATLRLPSIPERVWHGRITYVYPTVHDRSRTVTARLSFPNPDGVLRPGLYASVRIHAQPIDETLYVARSAVLHDGSDKAYVFTAQGRGRFRLVPVRIGIETPERVQILSGLRRGEQVVAHGQFMLDADAQIQGVAARMNGPAPAATGAVQKNAGAMPGVNVPGGAP